MELYRKIIKIVSILGVNIFRTERDEKKETRRADMYT
jgi:hypothetical protein